MKLSLNNFRLRNKMLIVYILSVFAPIVLTNIIFYMVTTENVTKQRMEDITLAVEQIKNEFRSEIDDAVGISSVFYTDHLLNEILEENYQHPLGYIEAYDSYIRRILHNYSPVYHSVQGITVYVDNPTILESGGVNYSTDFIKEKEWYRAVTERDLSRPIFMRTETDGVVVNSTGVINFSIIRILDYYTSQNKWEKVLKIDMRMSSIRQIFSNLNLQGNMYLVNDQGQIEYTTDPDVDWQANKIDYDSMELPEGTFEFETEYSVVNYLDGWKIIGTIPKTEVLSEVSKSRNFVILLACINMVIPTIIIIWITRSINVRLVKILKHMKKVKNQIFEPIPHVASRDEIGQLTGEFNRMTLQIKSLIDDVYVADIQKKTLEIKRRQAQLNALQSQINPHFLFNALETIRMRSIIKDENETAKIIQSMAKIFRKSLTWGKDWVTISEELDLVQSFLEIQKYRFGDKLDYHIDVDPAVYDRKIPKMTLQPLVENASIHGIEPLKGSGLITVAISKEKGHLIYKVTDNGAGMSEEKLTELKSYLQEEHEMGENVGVKNVFYRLQMVYGDQLDYDITSELGQGTMVTIKVPEQD